ncbi:MAG: hypothetical protein JNN17_23055 [Verrucomicrobiaceae bacterium]|nr:hypothetical protein [Verrucomicrobiaceae bacterium]
MKKNRQLPGPGPSFFAFQAVIMGLIGVMILIALFFAAFGNSSQGGEAKNLSVLRSELEKARSEKARTEQVIREKASLEKEREILTKKLAQSDPKAAEAVYQQRLAEIDAANQTRNQLDEQVAEAQGQYDRLREEKGMVRLAYRQVQRGRTPIIAVLENHDTQVVTAPDGAWGKLPGALFLAKLSQVEREKVHVVLYARPSAIELLEELRAFLKKNDFTFGYQAVGENEQLSFLPE